MSKFYCDRDGQISTIVMPAGWLRHGPRPARPLADWPPARELAVCIAIVLGAAVVDAWRAVRRV